MHRPNFGRLRNISTATTTVVKTGPGIFVALTLNEPTAGITTIFDNTAGSGTVIATIPAATPAQTLAYMGQFTVGLTIVTAGADDMTVTYG